MAARADTVGFIGLGRMGGPMAANLLRHGFPLVVHDLDPAKTAAAAALGATVADGPATVADGPATVADGPAAVARQASRTVCMVETTAQVEAVVAGPGGLIETAEAGDIVIVMATVDPLAVKALHARLAERGATLIDAPVSGGVVRAERGDLSTAVGGEDAAVAACRPVLEAMCSRIFPMGGVGQGLAMKLVNNMLNQIAKVAVAEAMVLGVKAGLDARQMIEMISSSSGQSATFEAMAPRYLSGDFANASTIDISYKDQELETAFAKALGVPMFMAAVSQQVYQMARAHGLNKEDGSALIKLYERMAGVQLGPRD
ncbi:MAG: NAD(P)-dependent oxidoreductase [Alphaproteobacteria bacterium]|nr:NAD(P)-dependent oxidoreductase [Alphaproteobacteria bacterium]MCB9929342.1 NAD(P)-dependent oxidoreductase [Alphaproteobacteria bacterium]